MDFDPKKYYLRSGTVQAFVFRDGGGERMFMHFFGRAEYDENIPIITNRMRERVQPILDKLNSGEITEDKAKNELDKIYW